MTLDVSAFTQSIAAHIFPETTVNHTYGGSESAWYQNPKDVQKIPAWLNLGHTPKWIAQEVARYWEQHRFDFATMTLAVCLPFLLTYVVSSIKSSIAVKSSRKAKRPVPVPYWIPFLGNVVPFLWNPAEFIAWTTEVYGFSTPLSVRLGPVKLYLVAGGEQLTALFKASSKYMSTKSGVLLALENIFGTPKDVIPWYAADDSGVLSTPAPESKVKPEHRLNFFQVRAAHKHLSGIGLTQMTETFLEVLGRRIETSQIGEQWTEMPDFYKFLQHEIFNAAVEALCGEHLLTQYPGFADDFWEFDRSVPILFRGLPRWLVPKPYKVRQRLLDAVKNWHRQARANSDPAENGPDSPEWDPWWGSRLMRARQDYTSRMHFMNADALASEDLGLIFAMNTNAIPAIGWFFIEFCRDPDLLTRAMAEVEAASVPSPEPGKPEFDINRLCNNSPLLQSVYAETLRLRVALIVTRTPQKRDFQAGDWLFPEGGVVALSSRSAAMNPAIWNAGTEADPHPLDQFYADRFLAYPGDANSGPRRKVTAPSQSSSPETSHISQSATKSSDPRFTMSGVAEGWIPYGGGERVCPGRHFAKQEIICSFAMLFKHYEIEFRNSRDWTPQPDMRFFPFGGLPPKGRIPFAIRRRTT